MAESNVSAPVEPVAVSLKLVDREFMIACAPEERDDLLASAAYLDRKMRELRANAKVPGFDRLAVLAAISVTHEFLALRKTQTASQGGSDASGTAESLAALRRKLEAALDAHIK